MERLVRTFLVFFISSFTSLSLWAEEAKIPPGQPIGTAGFNDMLGKQIKPGTLSVEEQPDGSFLLTNKLQTLSAHITHNGVVFDSIGNSAGKGGFSLKLGQWGREDSLQIVRSLDIYKKDDAVYHTHTDGLAEKFCNTSGGIQQDFIVAVKPQGSGDLHIRLQVNGATVNQKDNGAIIALNSGRQLTYDHIKVLDATGKIIPSEIQVDENNMIDIAVADSIAKYPLYIDPTVGDANWNSFFGEMGTDGNVYAIAISGNKVYIGGSFKVAGNIYANNIAMWDGSQWNNLGLGITGCSSLNCIPKVSAIAIDSHGSVYAGGNFTHAGGSKISSIARWDGVSWKLIDYFNSVATVYALAIDSSDHLYVAWNHGFVLNPGGVGAMDGSVSMWDGYVWNQSSPLGYNDLILSIALDNKGNLYAGDYFGDIYRWTNGKWSKAFGFGNGHVNALAIDSNGNVFAGGTFNYQGHCLAEFDGNSINISNNTLVNCQINSMSTYNFGTIYLGGTDNNGNSFASKWDGTSWQGFDYFVNNTINAIAMDNSGNVYFGGNFTPQYSNLGNHIGKYNGSSAMPLSDGITGEIYSLSFDKAGNLYIAGAINAYVNGQAAWNILKWSGSGWDALGGGIKGGTVKCVATDNAGNIYVGGDFAMQYLGIGNYISEWSGSGWSALGNGLGGQGISGTKEVNAIAIDSNGVVYAGGNFNIADGNSANFIAAWNGAAWTPLGSGTDGVVNALTVDTSNNLYVGGGFSTAGGVSSSGIAVWNGSNWSALPGLIGTVNAIQVNNSGIYVGTDGGTTQWNGSSWKNFGVVNTSVSALASDANNNLFIATSNNFYKWDGSNLTLLGGSGILRTDVYSPSINTLAVDSNSNLYIGGYFNIAGPLVSVDLGIWSGDQDGDGVANNQDCYPFDPSQSQCLPGTFATGVGSQVAQAGGYASGGNLFMCPSGTYNPTSGMSSSSSCLTVSSGYFATAGSVAPTKCPLNTNSYFGAGQCFPDLDGNGFPDNLDQKLIGNSSSQHDGATVWLADFDNDGYIDIAVGSPNANPELLSQGKLVKVNGGGSVKIISGYDGTLLQLYFGASNNDHIGTAIAVLPDIDNDGISDIAVGYPRADVGSGNSILHSAGQVIIYSGKFGVPITSIYGTQAGEHFGSTIGIGDVNGDSLPDLIVGSESFDTNFVVNGINTVLKNVGRISVFNGISTNLLYTRTGSQAGENFGSSISVDTSNHQIIVGSPGYTVTKTVAGKSVELSMAGRVQIYDGTDLTGSSPSLLTVYGQNKGNRFGASVSSFSQDINGDGLDDWAVGIPGFDVPATFNGKPSFLKDAGRVVFYSGLNSVPLASHIDGVAAGGNFGASLSGTGDINKDGIAELAVGSPNDTVSSTANNKPIIFKNAGRVELFSGATLF